MNIFKTLITITLFGVMFQVAAKKPTELNQVAENRYEQKQLNLKDSTVVNHSFVDAESGEFLNISSRTSFASQKKGENNTEFHISSNRGSLIINQQGITIQMDGHIELIQHHEKSLKKITSQAVLNHDLLLQMQEEIEQQALGLKRGSSCDAATTGAAHAVGMYARALFSGDWDGANFWYSVYQGHVYNMRTFCEIQ
ncbi:hypothetical protein OS175_10690 [Marinicella sp. S1101]|uniref:hypothetical protein n=1 Tax=Marinicella marina TaxID=2996016 RepID=UPI002260D59A|nr:hypothetical protein [Marinicella marina]MCX7554348.1 hypothetical protein [Marinicella marina]MDJ1138661.1 hypothetical protein [Marinicella marina]